ncbi:MAG: hypothetical protein CM1200mP41_02540 [Gammaproteobacteria bacterium]|nr:MAG: hypothetical protein CM1200mP41_02540 [Gammaproteobacteria bacterium]
MGRSVSGIGHQFPNLQILAHSVPMQRRGSQTSYRKAQPNIQAIRIPAPVLKREPRTLAISPNQAPDSGPHFWVSLKSTAASTTARALIWYVSPACFTSTPVTRLCSRVNLIARAHSGCRLQGRVRYWSPPQRAPAHLPAPLRSNRPKSEYAIDFECLTFVHGDKTTPWHVTT